MNTGQSLLSIGALLLLSLTVLRVNNSILATDETLQDSKLGVLAVSLATSVIEEASKKAFDAITADGAITDLSALTSPYSLGPGAGETPETFNDFDDYNGYTKHDTINTIDYTIACQVNYISPDNVDGIIMERTWHKKINVILTSSLMNDTLNFSSVYSYWHFR
jgi:MSHA pilin protein MshD